MTISDPEDAMTRLMISQMVLQNMTAAGPGRSQAVESFCYLAMIEEKRSRKSRAAYQFQTFHLSNTVYRAEYRLDGGHRYAFICFMLGFEAHVELKLLDGDDRPLTESFCFDPFVGMTFKARQTGKYIIEVKKLGKYG